MTPKYWFRIVLGMLAIFAVGMFVRAMAHKGKVMVTDFTHGNGPITVPLLGMPFRLGGVDVGSLQRLRIERSAPKMVSGFHLYATVDDTVAIARLADCRLTVTNPDNINEHTSFTCVSAEDSAKQVMVPFGTVTLQPSGRELVLLVPESVRRDIQNHSDHPGAAERSGDSVDIAADSGSMNIKVNGRDILSLKGDSSGGHMVVHDEAGKEVVNMKFSAPPARPKAAVVTKP